MSEEHDTDALEEGSSKSVNRRRFVKGFSVASGAAAFGALGSTRVSVKDNKNTSNIKIEKKSSANKAIQKSQSSQKYRILKKHLHSEEDLVLDNADIEVYVHKDVEGPGARRVSSFPMSSTTTEKLSVWNRSNITTGKDSGSNCFSNERNQRRNSQSDSV